MQSNNEIWIKAGHVSQNYQFMGQVSKVFSNIWFKRELTDKITKFFIYFKNGMCSIYFQKNEIEENSKILTDKVLKNPEWGIKLLSRIEKKHSEYFKYTEGLRNISYSKQSGKKLIKLLEGAQTLNLIGHEVTRSLSWQLDKDNIRLNKEILQMVRDQIKAKDKNFKARIILPELATPLRDTFIFKEQVELLNIAKRIVKDENVKDLFSQYDEGKKIFEEIMKKDDKIYNSIHEHYKNYRWLSYLYQESAYDLDYYIHRLKEFALNESSIARLLSRYKDGKKKTQDVRKIILKELGFNKRQLQILEFSRRLSFIKEYRKAVIAHGTFCIEKIYLELSKKYNVTMDQIRMLDYHELKKAVQSNNFGPFEMKKRVEEVMFLYKRGFNRKVLFGQDASQYFTSLQFDSTESAEKKEIAGIVASSGLIKGTVRVINKPEDIDKMQEGDIIVTRITATSFGPAINKASGIISECGGLTCHAAIVSRELKVPCLVSVDDATEILKDGDEVELDADNGIVNIL